MARKTHTKAYESVEGVPRFWGGRMRQDGIQTAVQNFYQYPSTNISGHVKTPENQTQGMY
jgi:hypothetical protein